MHDRSPAKGAATSPIASCPTDRLDRKRIEILPFMGERRRSAGRRLIWISLYHDICEKHPETLFQHPLMRRNALLTSEAKSFGIVQCADTNSTTDTSLLPPIYDGTICRLNGQLNRRSLAFIK